MRHSTRVVVLAIVAIMVSAAPLRAGQVDDPESKAWASFKVGSSRTITGKSTGGFLTQKVAYQSTLVKIADGQVTIQTQTTANGRLVSRQAQPVATKIDQKDIKYIGEESVDAMGKTFKCKVYEMAKITSPNGAKSSQSKKWICDDVPGGLVKVEVHLTEPGPSAGQQYKRTETSLLTAYEAK
jgi:hypothetical protein